MPAPIPQRPIITLLTDFGTRDHYVATLKGVILGLNPEAILVDLSHEEPPQDIAAGAFVLAEAAPYFPPGTIHLAVVDPGVGTSRRGLAARCRQQYWVGPDNGLFHFVFAGQPPAAGRIRLLNPGLQHRVPGGSGLFPEIGKEISGMGADARDFDNDGRVDIFQTALDGETMPLFRNRGGLSFEDWTGPAGLVAPTLANTGWSNGIVDFNNDGWKDLFVAGGGVVHPKGDFAERAPRTNTVYVNLRSGKFVDASAGAGKDFASRRAVHRGAAFGDLDGDGRMDAVVSALEAPLEIWRNVSPAPHHWLLVKTVGSKSDAFAYRTLFTTMIRQWRADWGRGDLPFLWVQLANFRAPVEEPGDSDWAMLRESQSSALALPRTGQAVAIDIGDAADIHPRNKQEVGRRLALAARKVAYREELVFSGPTYRSHEVKDGRVVIAFDHVGAGLAARGRSDGRLAEFAIAGADGKFIRAEAKVEGDRVVVWHEKVPEPAAVRYAWADNPAEANLVNAEGLPASPFRSTRGGQ